MITKMNYPILLFDADNTIFDFDRAEIHAITSSLRQYGFPCSETIVSRYHDINQGLWREHEKGLVTKDQLKVRRFERLFAELGVDGDPVAFHHTYIGFLGEGTFLLPHAADVCRTLAADRRLYIITNGLKASQTARFARSEIMPLFEDAFISECIGCQKPEKAFFDYVAAHIPGFQPSDALVIGDSLTSDMAGGHTAGLDTCWFNPRRLPNDSGIPCTYEIHDLRELTALLSDTE